MNRDLQTCLHVLESGSVNEEALQSVLHIFFEFSKKTEDVANNRGDVATVYCLILKICQELYDIDVPEKLPDEVKTQLVRCFENIERLFIDAEEKERRGTYVRTIWFLSELKTKSASGRSTDIDKQLIGEHARDLLEILGDIRFIFDIEFEGKRLFPISQVIAAVISGYDFQKFKSGVQINDIYTLYLAVRLFQTPEDTSVLEKLKKKCNLMFIEYLSKDCQVIDTVDFLNYQYNGTIIFYNARDARVLIRSEHEDYFDSAGTLEHSVKSEFDYDGNRIGWFIEYNLNVNDRLCDYSEILTTESGRRNFLRLVYDNGYRNIFLQKSIIEKPDGTIAPINPYCRKDSRLVQGYLKRKKGKSYPQDEIRSLLQKYRICSVKSNVLNRVTFGLCLLLLEINNTGVDTLGLDSLEESSWYQAQVIQNWIDSQEISVENIKKLLCEWYSQLSFCEKATLLEKAELQPLDFLPLKQDLSSVYRKLLPDQLSDEKLYSGRIMENDEEAETYFLEILTNTVASKKAKKLGNLPQVILTECLQREAESLKWDQRVGIEEYFFYSTVERKGHVLNRELLKALSGVELILENCLEFIVGHSVTEIDFQSVFICMKLFDATYCEVAMKTKACIPQDLESQTYLRLLYNMIWSKIDTEEKKDNYFGIFMEHQIAAFDEISDDDMFVRKDDNTLYVPKDSIAQSAVLSNIFEKRLKAEAKRDIRHLYELELTQTDDERYAVYGEPIERIIFLTDNMVGGLSTIAALAAQLGIEEDTEFHISAERVKQADATRHRYLCKGQEVLVGDILRTNSIKMKVHAFYGTNAACRKVDAFLKKHGIPFEGSNCHQELIKTVDESIIESAKIIWGNNRVKIKPNHYLYVREYNMPKSSIFPAEMIENPMLMINLLFRNKELNQISNIH